MKALFPLILAGTFLGVYGCNSNPYPEKTGEIVVARPDPDAVKVEPFGLEVASLLDFSAGSLSGYGIKAWAPGATRVSVSGLPDGAFFLASESKIIWAPSAQAALDPKDPVSGSRTYVVQVEVSGTDEPAAFLSDNITLVARQSTASRLTLDAAAFPGWGVKALQGSSLAFTYADFPGFQASIWTEGLPSSASLAVAATAGVGTITYAPPSDGVGFTRSVPAVITLSNSAGQVVSQVSFVMQVTE